VDGFYGKSFERWEIMLRSNIENMCVIPLVSPSISIEHLERCVWSIESQEPVPFDFDIVIVVNSLDRSYTKSIQDKFAKDYDIHVTESNGKSGMGHNARYDTYRKIYKEREYTHVMAVDGDDYYYPMAFECIDELQKKSRFDYLSGTCPYVDTIRQSPPDRQDPRSTIPLGNGTFLWSFLDQRYAAFPKIVWDGVTCPGGEPPLCLSNNAIEKNFRYLDDLNLADDYPHMCQGIASYLRGEIIYVNTDCNDIYVYDCLVSEGSSSRMDQNLDPDRGWPFDVNGILHQEIVQDEYKILSEITLQHLPYATLPQVWNEKQKSKYILENVI